VPIEEEEIHWSLSPLAWRILWLRMEERLLLPALEYIDQGED
jgi:hypothetical protein